jgi:hypothetical protein
LRDINGAAMEASVSKMRLQWPARKAIQVNLLAHPQLARKLLKLALDGGSTLDER